MKPERGSMSDELRNRF